MVWVPPDRSRRPDPPPPVPLPPPRRDSHETITLLWRAILPIACFILGGALLIYTATAASPSPIVIAAGLVLVGLGPAGLLDVIKKIP